MRVEYSIDSRDIVTGCNDGWAVFAIDNDAPELVPPPADRTLWSYFAGAEVRTIWLQVVRDVREKGHAVTLPFRCDAPAARRWFDMTISPRRDDGVHFATELTREEQRPAVAQLAPSPARDADSPLLRVCSWCNRCHDGEAWVSIESLLQKRPLLAATAFPATTHGICPSCEADILDAAGL